MLHIVNGDATAGHLTAVPGEVAVWRDILVEGPVDVWLPAEALGRQRAPWLARRLGIAAGDYLTNAGAQAEALTRAMSHEEVVLWFEQDLFCVANLAYLGAWLAEARPDGRVSLVFPADPLGSTEARRLAALFAERRTFSDAAIAHAAAWWRAYAGPDPRALEMLAAGPGALPFLDRAARVHLARFPSVRAGLGSVEAAALAALDEVPRAVSEVFHAATHDDRMRGHGMSDLQFAAHLHALADGPSPLVTITERDGAITPEGRAVRAGRRDRVDAQALDWWLGGVHLEGHHVRWRWDESRERLRS